MTYLERARAFFENDRFAMGVTGIQIDAVEDDYARCSLALDTRHLNAAGSVMGGVMFTLADFAFAVAANLNQPTTVTLSSQITFLAPPRGNCLSAEARLVHRGHRTCYYEVQVSDESGAVCACVGVSGFTKRE